MRIFIAGVTTTENKNDNKSIEDIFKEKCLAFMNALKACDEAEFELYQAKHDIIIDFDKFNCMISSLLERIGSSFDLIVKTSCGNQYILHRGSKGWRYVVVKEGNEVEFSTSTAPFTSRIDYEEFKAQILTDLCTIIDKKQAVVDENLKKFKEELADWKKEDNSDC